MIEPANLDGLFDASFNPIDVSQLGSAQVVVNAFTPPEPPPGPEPEPPPAPVPEPATLGLVLAGLVLGVGRKKLSS